VIFDQREPREDLFTLNLLKILLMNRLFYLGISLMVTLFNPTAAQNSDDGKSSDVTNIFKKGNYFVGSGALFNNYLGNSEEIITLALSGQTGYFHRDRLMLGTDLRVRADYLKATRKFNKDNFTAESIWFVRYYFGKFFPQLSLGIANGIAVRTGLGLGYQWQIGDQFAIVPVYNRLSRNLNRNPGPVRNAFDQPVPSAELQIGLVYFFKN
jgi:hypothetical protein